MRMSATNSAVVRGRPFSKGHDVRRGHGPKRGAPNAGRPPDEFKALLAALASREETVRALETILADPNHPHFIQALKFAADRGYGHPNHNVSLDVPAVVLVAPGKLTTEEWMRRYGGADGSPPAEAMLLYE